MWAYRQVDGWMIDPNKARLARGYSGNGAGTNNPSMQSVHNVGPIPQGLYHINTPEDTPTHGPFVLWLTPDPGNTMFDRAGFGIHGDSIEHPGLASDGCIILSRPAREIIAKSDDETLEVVSGQVFETSTDEGELDT